MKDPKNVTDQSVSDQYASALEELKKHAEELEAKAQEYEEKYRRALADYRNLEQRVQVERVQYSKLANRWLLESLLEPLDFMEKATEHIEDKGLKMVTQRFYQVLDQEGLKEIDAMGKMFDEKTMEAIDTVEGEENKVIKVAAKGFMLHDQVLRHAKVVVGNGEKNN
jgi:molecular chaperone GrpE